MDEVETRTGLCARMARAISPRLTPGSPLSDGGRLDLATGFWSRLEATPHVEPRFFHTAVRTDEQVLIFGGSAAGHPAIGTGARRVLETGARHDLETGAIEPSVADGAPFPRAFHSAV